MEIGGGFGGKTTIYLEPVAAALSRKSGHPVKVTMSRADVLEGSGPTSGSYMWVKIGVNKRGQADRSAGRPEVRGGSIPRLARWRGNELHLLSL